MDTIYSGAMAFVATATDDIRVSELRQNLGKTAPTGIKANGNGIRYLQKKEEGGGRNRGNIPLDNREGGQGCHHLANGR